MRPQDYGLVYYHGEFKHFIEYTIIKEAQGTRHIKVILANGVKVTIHRYYNKKRGRFIEAEEAIHRHPAQIITTGEINEDH